MIYLSAALGFGAACGSSTEASSSSEVRTIRLSVGNSEERGVSLVKGEPLPLTVTSTNAAGQAVQPRAPYVFLTRNATVATVSATGVVTAREVGTAWIVVQLDLLNGGGLSDSIAVTVGVGA